ncbi:transposase family protein [Pseudarcicella hirudinis]|uniref:integrase catalytic domain-containing protein n=1 Tax=Pseudarcicella hirudinis TaxID=1079859 RepID=UPI0035EC6E63
MLWEIDATPINITPHYWEDPNEVTTKKKDLAMGRAVLSVVRDHATQDILGYSLDMSENRHMVINALRMAIERTGKLPYELRYDRGSWYGTDEVETIIKKFQGFGVKTTETTSPTGKPGVERWFETFQSVFLIDSDYYIGEGVKSRRENAHRSADQLTKQFQQAKRENWKFEDAVKEIAGYINEYRKTKLSKYSKKYKNVDYSPSELYNLFDDYEGSVNIERWEIADLLWKTTKLKITRRTVRLQVHNEVCLFPLIESKAAKYAINAADILMKHAEIVVKYDERDLSEVMIFTPDTGDFLGSLARNDGFDGYGKDAEWGKIAEFQAKQKQTSEAIKKKAKILMEAGQYDPMAILASHKVSKAAAVEAETAAFLPNIAEMKENIKRRGTKKGKAAEPVKVMDDFWGQW